MFLLFFITSSGWLLREASLCGKVRWSEQEQEVGELGVGFSSEDCLTRNTAQVEARDSLLGQPSMLFSKSWATPDRLLSQTPSFSRIISWPGWVGKSLKVPHFLTVPTRSPHPTPRCSKKLRIHKPLPSCLPQWSYHSQDASASWQQDTCRNTVQDWHGSRLWRCRGPLKTPYSGIQLHACSLSSWR